MSLPTCPLAYTSVYTIRYFHPTALCMHNFTLVSAMCTYNIYMNTYLLTYTNIWCGGDSCYASEQAWSDFFKFLVFLSAHMHQHTGTVMANKKWWLHSTNVVVLVCLNWSLSPSLQVWELFMENVSWLGATCRVTLVGHTHTVRCLQSDEHRIISGSYDHTLKIWDIDTGTCRHTLR